MSAALCFAIWLAVQGTEPQGAPADSPASAAEAADDVTLLGQVRRVAFQVEALRGRQFARPPDASRASVEALDAAVAARALRMLPAERLAARGRAWADLGLGAPDTPARILRRLAADLPGVFPDSRLGKIILGPEFLTDRDFSRQNPDDPESVIFMSAGLRPDEPLLAHALVHLLDRGTAPNPPTTDALLCRAAWSEGEATLLAIRLLFRSLRIGDDLFKHEVDPARVLGGRLLGEPTEGLPVVEKALVDFVHQEGFAQAVLLFKKGGWGAVEQGAAARVSSRDLLHPDRPRPAGSGEAAPEAPPLADPALARRDEDSLGEQGIVVLVSSLTGKEDLGLAAGDGWVGDSLERWEYPDGQGVTLWTTAFGSDADTEEFVYAWGRCMEDGLAATRIESTPAPALAWTAGGRVYRLDRSARRVSLRIAGEALDREIEKTPTAAGAKTRSAGT